MENFAENSAVHREIAVSSVSATHYTRCPFTKKAVCKEGFITLCIMLTMFSELGLHDYDHADSCENGLISEMIVL